MIKKVSMWLGGVKKYALTHKVISSAAIIIVLFGGWYAYGKATSTTGEVRYVLGTASTSTIIATVSGSGQISSSNTVDIKPKVSGTITWVGVKAGQKVYAGQAIASIDAADARQALVSAQQSLAASELQYQKDAATAPIDFQKDQTALTNAQGDLADEYISAYNTLSSTYLDEPAVATGLNNILYGFDFSQSNSQWNVDALANLFVNDSQKMQIQRFATSAKADYTAARNLYDPAILAYKATSRTSTPDVLEAMIQQSIDSTTALAQAAQSELNFLSQVNDLAQANNQKLPTTFTTLQTNARSYLSTANSDLSALLAEKKAISNEKQAVTTAQQNITLDQVGNTGGSNPISLQISANNIAKQKADIASQEANLADYTIVAPFSGVLSAVDAKVGDTAGSTAVASIITTQNVVDLSLNEVDAAKVAVGQKATLTFDAIEDLTLTGTVAEIDAVGTVSQGVVSYAVKITLDTQDARIKSGMTVNATIQSATHANVLTVPSSAVKTIGGSSYVMVFNPPLEDTAGTAGLAVQAGVLSATPPAQVPVIVGISDDTNVEILSGLVAGQQIVTRTITGTTAKATTATTARTTTVTGGAVRAGGGNAGFSAAPVRL